MATLPSSATNIRLLTGVPFAADYKNTRWFDTLSEQTSYFMSKPTTYEDTSANFQRIEGRYYVKVAKNIDSLWGTNYLMFQNSAYNSKWFYAFVTKLEYINNGNTYVHFQLDVLQTWRFDMNFKPSFVVREHRPLWNSDGTPVINTIDEGLNYGTEYDTVYVHNYKPAGGYKWLIIVGKEPIHKVSDGEPDVKDATVIGTPQPLSYYMIPFKDNDDVPTILLKNGEDTPVSPPTRILSELYKDEKAVNNISALYVTDYPGFPVEYMAGQQGTPDVLAFPDNNNDINPVTVGDQGLILLKADSIPTFTHQDITINEDKYEGFTKSKESKLLMYPYTVTVLDDFRGNRVEYKNEYIKNKALKLIMKGSTGVSNKISFGVIDYNMEASSGSVYALNEFSLINNTANDLPIRNDYLAAFLQGNRNSIENQKNTIMFNGLVNGIGSTVSGLASAATGNVLGAASSGMSITQGAGNTVLQLQGIEAKQKDISNMPPQITKMGSNTAYDYGNGYNGVFIIKKQIKPEYRKKLEDFFNMFGYKTNEVKVPNFHTRRYWNYVQTASCVITGNFNNEDLTELRAVFDNGITLWHTDDVGNYSLNNEVI